MKLRRNGMGAENFFSKLSSHQTNERGGLALVCSAGRVSVAVTPCQGQIEYQTLSSKAVPRSLEDTTQARTISVRLSTGRGREAAVTGSHVEAGSVIRTWIRTYRPGIPILVTVAALVPGNIPRRSMREFTHSTGKSSTA